MYLKEVSAVLYKMELPFDSVYQILNENNVPIGLIYLSFLDNDGVYIEWVEILTVFRGRGYLRKLFRELTTQYEGKVICLECGEKLLKKYLGIGCVKHGVSPLTDNYMLTYGNLDGDPMIYWKQR